MRKGEKINYYGLYKTFLVWTTSHFPLDKAFYFPKNFQHNFTIGIPYLF